MIICNNKYFSYPRNVFFYRSQRIFEFFIILITANGIDFFIKKTLLFFQPIWVASIYPHINQIDIHTIEFSLNKIRCIYHKLEMSILKLLMVAKKTSNSLCASLFFEFTLKKPRIQFYFPTTPAECSLTPVLFHGKY